VALDPGYRLGPYEVVSALGAGGMGEVYKARDTRLDRTVAVKVLPSELAGDADSLARFEREAHVVAALDHPHICGIYDVGSVDGTHYLVMPHLEGETVASRLERGPLPLDQALKIAVEISDALDKAHRQGVIHRDLKPANIMLTRTGSKLLDFGVAKLRPRSAPTSTSTMAQTVTAAPKTAHGTILGTVQYMAPEQLEGREADARSDIWALGAVLYEMTTGVRPFAGDTPASVIGAILRDTPAAISTRRPLSPRALDTLIDHCLAKDPDERWQSIGDVRKALDSIAANETREVDARTRRSGVWRERGVWIATTTVLLIALAIIALRSRPGAPPTEITRLSVDLPASTIFAPQMDATVSIPQFAISADGRSVVFAAGVAATKPTLWLRQFDDVEARSMAGTEDAQAPFWSPDGRWIAFFDPPGNLKRVAVSGGTVQTVARDIIDPRGASWGTDDTILFGTGSGEIYGVAAAGGTPRPVTRLDSSKNEGSHRWPEFLPDGRHFLFTARSGLADHRNVYVGTLDGETRHLVLHLDSDAHYVASGYLLFLDGDTLLAQPFDSGRLVVSGQPTPIAARVGRSSRGHAAFSVSRTGTIAYASATLRTGRLTWFDRHGIAVSSVGPDGEQDYADFRLSRDETRLAVSLVDPKLSAPDIWLFDLARGGASRLTFGPALNAAAVWSPQGDRIIFRTNRTGLLELYQKSAVAGGNDEPLIPEDVARRLGIGQSSLLPTDWSSDGQHVVFAAGGPTDIWLLTMTDPTKPVRVVQSPGDQMHANFSPDGGFVAYSSNESGRFDVYVQSLRPPARRWPISVNGGYEPRWRADGGELYYLTDDQTLMAVPVTAGAAPFGVPTSLFRADVHPGVSALRTHYVPNRDGSRFLIHRRSPESTSTTITVVLNGMAALKQ